MRGLRKQTRSRTLVRRPTQTARNPIGPSLPSISGLAIRTAGTVSKSVRRYLLPGILTLPIRSSHPGHAAPRHVWQRLPLLTKYTLPRNGPATAAFLLPLLPDLASWDGVGAQVDLRWAASREPVGQRRKHDPSGNVTLAFAAIEIAASLLTVKRRAIPTCQGMNAPGFAHESARTLKAPGTPYSDGRVRYGLVGAPLNDAPIAVASG